MMHSQQNVKYIVKVSASLPFYDNDKNSYYTP
jgi:hypothetical protein